MGRGGEGFRAAKSKLRGGEGNAHPAAAGSCTVSSARATVVGAGHGRRGCGFLLSP